MQNKTSKKVLSLLVLSMLSVSTVMSSISTVNAEDNLLVNTESNVSDTASDAVTALQEQAQRSTEVDNNIFIPFRSDYAKYITQNANKKSDVTQYIWLKLFEEELNWNSSKPWYNNHFATWSNMYFGDYVSSSGEIKSSEGVQVTYNAEFDTALYQTIINNPEFVINWLNKKPEVFKQYAKTAREHEIFGKAIVDLTADGTYLGGGKDSETNVFLRGVSSTSSSKLNAKWSNEKTTVDTYDIDILRIFGANYSALNDTQKTWVRTYMQWMVDDYVSHGASAVAAPNNSPDLYRLIATSYEGFVSAKGQEFFNYCINNADVYVGELLVNAAEGYKVTNQLWTGKDDVAKNNTDMSLIFMASDADCDYKSETDLGDEDYDWLAYNICFGSGYWARTRELVSGNESTYQQMQDWLMRYYMKHQSAPGGGDITEAIARAGQTLNIYHDGGIIVSACNTQAGVQPGGKVDASFWCGGHSDEASATFTKKIGVRTISFSSSYPGGAGGSQGSKYRWKVYDQKTGRVISESGWTTSGSVTLSNRDTWSSTIVVECGVRIYHGHGNQQTGYSEHVGSGSCYGTLFTRAYNTFDVNGTYADVSYCTKNGHSYVASDYVWNDDHTSCTCVMMCPNCGDKHSVTDNSIETKNYDDRVEYYADFAHTDAAPKTATVLKGTGEKVFYASDMSGKASGVGSGTCALPATKIPKSPKSVSFSVKGTAIVYKIVNKYGQIIDNGKLGGSNGDVITRTIDLSYHSDKELEGLYIAFNIKSETPTYSKIGVYVKQVPGPFSVNYVKFNY